MANFNSVVVVGRLTRDPELRYVPSGAPVCSFSVATSRRYTKEGGEKVEETTFLDVDVWKRLAETCSQFLKKGREVLVMGTLRQSRWVDQKTQQKRSKIRIVANIVQFLGRRPDEEPYDAALKEAQAGTPAAAEVDIPEPSSEPSGA